jgi:hypothetical protein
MDFHFSFFLVGRTAREILFIPITVLNDSVVGVRLCSGTKHSPLAAHPKLRARPLTLKSRVFPLFSIFFLVF